MVDYCGKGLFHHIARQHRPIQVIAHGVPGDLGIWEYLLDIPGTPSPDQQFSRAAIFAYNGQKAVGEHYPHNFPSMFSLIWAATGRLAIAKGRAIERSVPIRDARSRPVSAANPGAVLSHKQMLINIRIGGSLFPADIVLFSSPRGWAGANEADKTNLE
jgi:hypothetical protein